MTGLRITAWGALFTPTPKVTSALSFGCKIRTTRRGAAGPTYLRRDGSGEMILTRAHGETWIAAAMRFGRLGGMGKQQVRRRVAELEAEGHDARQAAYLTLAERGIVDDAAL